MNFSLSDDHQMLKDSAQVFLNQQISLKPLLTPGATVREAGYGANWAKIADPEGQQAYQAGGEQSGKFFRKMQGG